MKTKYIIPACAVIFASLLSCFALDNEGLIQLHSAGFDEETILLKMDQEEAEYDLSTDGLIALKQAGISEAIIKKALTLDLGVAQKQSSATTTTATAAPAPAPAPASGNYGQQGEFSNIELPSIEVPKITPQLGVKYFTRVTFFHEGGKHIATNYGRGIPVPINTEVEIVAFKKKYFTLRIVATGEEILMVNEPKYTGHSVQTLPENYLAAVKTPIETLPEGLQQSILAGQLRLGMTKEIAIAARGYPPIHATPSTSSDRWVYWNSRFVQLTVVFRNDRLVEGRGLF